MATTRAADALEPSGDPDTPTAEDVLELLRTQGMRPTPQRLAIVEEILATAGYIVPLDVIQRVQARIPLVSPSTIYRTLERLEQLGVLTHVHVESGIGYHRVDEVKHAHLTCARCGAELELSPSALRRLERLVEAEHGFLPDFAHHAISGVCAACRQGQ